MAKRSGASIRHPGSLHRIRVQLGGGLFLSVLMPWLILASIGPELIGIAVVRQTIAGMIAAVVAGYYLFRSLTIFPGIRASSFILPAFSVSYGIVVIAFFFTRLEYSRSLFASSFVISMAWYFAVTILIQRQPNMRIGVVPVGEVASLAEVDWIDWVPLRSPTSGRKRIDAIVADFRADLPDEWERALADSALAGTSVFHVKQLRESLTGRVEIDHLSENSFGSLVPVMAYLKMKQVIDVITAIGAGALLLPALIIVGLIIRFESPGPAIFRQQRIGYRGRPFTVFKFRTMAQFHRHTRHDERAHAITRNDDERITRLGRFLRRTRIDELPQMWNVICGEMSWIGPRPEAAVLSRWYESELPFYRYRHIVRPGISGWAQVNQGHVADVDEVLRKLQYDFYYIKNFSPWLDLLIVLRTAKTMLTGFGSR